MKTDHSRILRTLRNRVDRYLERLVKQDLPATLYDPSRYILAGGGKRVRPLLVMLSCEAAGGSAGKALHAAAAMEILHNFTLVHDDIMDHAPSRRGRLTVHKKWDSNIAILTGDVLIGLAYRSLLRTRSGDAAALASTFTEGVVEVCEGQAYDKEFETDGTVTLNDYLMMIGKKTGKLISVSTELGAIIGGADRRSRTALRTYGKLVGRAFQVQDDLLDVVADERTFGKTIGGDLVEGKKTFLLLHALKHARGTERKALLRVFRHERIRRADIPSYRGIYERTGAIMAAEQQVAADMKAAHRIVNGLRAGPARDRLAGFTNELLTRTY